MKAPSIAIVNKLAVLWRRRRSIVYPLLILGAGSIAAAYVMPRTYVAHSLFMLQEADQGPLTRERMVDLTTEAARERIQGLQTLMKSERVLATVLSELKEEDAPKDPKQLALAVQNLRDSLSFQVISPEFLEIQLRGSSAVGLGHKLETVMAVLFESLIAPERNGETSSEMVLVYRKEQLEKAEAELRALRQRHPELARLRNLNMAPAVVNETVQPVGATPSPAGWRSAQTGAAESADGAGPATTATAEPGAAVGPGGPAKPAAATLPNGEPLDAKYRRLEEATAKARDDHSDISRRVGGLRNGQTASVLRAPERILIIDPPSDPQLPLLSKSKIIMIGLLAGLILGIGLLFLAELFDTRLRTPQQLKDLVPVPLLTRLPFDRRGFIKERHRARSA
jgi:capsular polysaccharide biosynthesis protein